MQAAKLAHQLDILNAPWFEIGADGLVRAVISAPAAEADLYMQGAHVTRWTPSGRVPQNGGHYPCRVARVSSCSCNIRCVALTDFQLTSHPVLS